MKKQTQRSLLKWASLLSKKQITSLIDIQNTKTLILLLNKLQSLAFQQLYNIDERTSNSSSNILKFINSYYKKQLHCNVTQLIDGLNIFKNPLLLWELLIGVAIKGKNCDANINVILQMQSEEQSQLMLLVEDVIEKLSQYDMNGNASNRSQLSDSSDINSRDRKQSQYSRMNNKRDEFLNQLIEENQLLKQKNHELHNQLSHLKSLQQQLKKTYEDRLNHFKDERYHFLQVLQAGSSTIESGMRSRNKSQYNFKESMHSSESKIFDDPLHELNISITGSLSDIAADMLNAIKNLKKQTHLHIEKASILQDHNKDLKTSLNQVVSENKHLKEEFEKGIKIEKQLQFLRVQNEQLIKNQTQLIKMMTQVEEQKQYLREMVEKLKEQKNVLILNQNKNNHTALGLGNNEKSHQNESQKGSNMLDPSFTGSNQRIDLMKAPSFILRQMNSQLEPESYNLNEQIDVIKNPALIEKYQKQIDEIKEKNQKQVEELKEKMIQLRQQNNELKQMNKMLQKTVHKSMEKSQQIQNNIEEGYKALFGIRSSMIQPGEEKAQNNQLSESVITIKISNSNNMWIDEQKMQKDEKKDDNKQEGKKQEQNSKILQFYEQVKKMVSAYEQKELLMLIEIESLKKQLQDLFSERQKDHNPDRYQQNRMAIASDNEQNFKKSQMVQIEQIPVTIQKQDSVLMFNINISGPGGQQEESQQNQEYQTRRSEMNKSSNSQKEEQKKQDMKNKKNRQPDPSQEFIEIQEGEELTDNDFPNIQFAKRSELKSIRESIHERTGEKLVKDIRDRNHYNQNPHTQFTGQLGMNISNRQNMNKMNRMSTISGMDLGFSNDKRGSVFARSGFYNQSFIQLSNRLQSQINQDINQMTQVINEKSRRKPSHFALQGSHQVEHHGQNQEQVKKQQEQNKKLITKLQNIKSSYSKIKQFHVTSTQQIQSQLKQQLQIQQSELTKLKLNNESLKQSLTLMLAQKQLTFTQIKQLKNMIKNINSTQQFQQLSNNFTQMFQSISQLQLIIPDLQTRLDNSKTKELQLLYLKEKYQKEKLQEQIILLMETILWFRNLAVQEDF